MIRVVPALAILLGGAIVAYALQTAIRTFLLPQPGLSLLSRSVFRVMYPVFAAIDRLPVARSRRHDWQAVYAPLCLVLIVFVTMVVIAIGYTLILFGLGMPSLEAAFLASISSVSTLGFATLPGGLAIPTVATLETMTGILIVALLIGYLPTIYAAVQQREESVAALVAHVGTPLSGEAILVRYARAPGLAQLDELWTEWRRWFAALGQSHDSLAGIIFVRSPQPEQSWVTASEAILDAAALTVSALGPPHDAGAERCLEIGSQALRQIVAGVRVPPDPARRKHGSRHVSQSEFDAAVASLAAAGLPVSAEPAAAWQEFAQWRDQYDASVFALRRLTEAPEATWPSPDASTREPRALPNASAR